MTRPPLVSDPEQVTPQWLTDVLTHAGALTDVRVVSFEAEDIGTGQVGCNVRYTLTYDREGAGPPTVVGKFASRDPASREAGIQTLTYETEAAFYRDLAHTVDIRRPHCYFVDHVPGTAETTLILEDLAPAEQGDQIAGCGVREAELAMVEAAKLHGPRWSDPTLAELSWLDRGDLAQLGAFYPTLWQGFVDRYRDTLIDEAVGIGERLGAKLASLATPTPTPQTVVHRDYRLDNMLFGTEAGGPPLAVVDWQTAAAGVGTADVSYFLGAGLSVEDRRAHERDLVALYHGELLSSYGVRDYTFEDCWRDYRRYTFSGFLMAVFASMLVGRTERGDAMFMAMANGHAVQITDLESEALLD